MLPTPSYTLPAKHSPCHRNRDGEVDAGVDDFGNSGDDFDDDNYDDDNIQGVSKKSCYKNANGAKNLNQNLVPWGQIFP